jgi:magnesium chelatase family protein
MTAKVFTSIPYGFDGRIIEVECAISQGLPQFDIVGMANKTVSEARQRVRNAIKSSGLKWPDAHITINLAPAELLKDGNFFDIPIAISILVASGQLLEQDTKDRIFVGELSLDGKVRPVRGIINILEACKKSGFKEAYIPLNNLAHANLFNKVKSFGVDTLLSLVIYLKNQSELPSETPNVVKNNKTGISTIFLSEIKGQELAKKALITAVAGHHNIILSGPPGAGKTMLAHAAASLLPDLTKEESIELTKIYNLTNSTSDIITSRPFRNPHHTSSIISLVGGGAKSTPGEVSLAHLGILYLDELPEYPRQTLESLRQPLEDKSITISRIHGHSTYPSDFMLLATMNPCPCGYLGDETHECKCKNIEIQRYKNKLSGPLLDRIDIRINVDRVKTSDLCSKKLSQEDEQKAAELQNVVKNNITEAINRQHQRYGSDKLFNANLTSTQVVKYIDIDKSAKEILDQSSERLNLSARSYFKVIKVARTIADLEAENVVKPAHIIEALSFRMEL